MRILNDFVNLVNDVPDTSKIVYDPSENEAIAFIMPNKPLYTADMPKYIVAIRDIETKTGLDFLSKLDKDKQDIVKTKKAKALWK